MAARRPFIVGLTGGIGSGKSAAADLFAALGAGLVDTDAIAHALTGPGGAAMAAIRSTFGEQVLRADGALDRAAMRQLVFTDAAARRRLEAVLHPLIRAESARQCLHSQAPYVVLVVPLLLESGDYRSRVDRLLVVDCPEAEQVGRVRVRSGLTEPEVLAIMAAQASRGERLAAADDVLDNGGTIDTLAGQVAALHAKYLSLAKSAAPA